MAIGKIFDESFGDYEKATSQYNSSKVYSYKVGDKEPYTYKPYTYSADTWSTEWSKLYCRKGGVKYGIAAPYLVGTILAGQNLFISTDGGYFRVDDNGVYVLNEKFTIASSNGNGLTFTADDGLVHKVTVNGKKYEAGFSASNNNKEGYGLYYMVDGKKKLYFDIDKPELVVDGSIWAREIYLGKDRKNINALTINDKGYDAIQGNCLDLKNILVKDDYGNVRFEIDGNGRYFKVYNGNIYLTNGSNEININPEAGLLFTKNGNEVVRLDIQTGDATFSGTVTGGRIISDTTIDVTTDATIGKTLKIVNNDNDGFFFTISAGGATGDRVVMSTSNKRILELITGSNINLEAGSNVLINAGDSVSITADSFTWGGKDVLTSSDLNSLNNEIKKLWAAVRSLQQSNSGSII